MPNPHQKDCLEEIQADCEEFTNANLSVVETQHNEGIDYKENNADEGQPWYDDSESQYLLDSQQLVEALSLCEDLLHSQSPNRDGKNDKSQPGLSVYARLGPEHLKKDIEECQKLVLDGKNDKDQTSLSVDAPVGPEHLKKDIEECNPANIEHDTPPEFRLSQLVFP